MTETKEKRKKLGLGSQILLDSPYLYVITTFLESIQAD